MPVISINNRQVDIDIRSELEQYEWTRAKWTHEKLIAASPFRYDSQPSFYVYLEDTPNAPAGSFGDSGAIDLDYAKGGFIKLLAFLRNEDEQSTVEYLLDIYSTSFTGQEVLTIDLSRLTGNPKPKTVDNSIIDQYRYRHPYLETRGISEKVQRIMGVGYDTHSNAITIPWHTSDNRLATVKYRTVNGKVFWYHKGGMPVKDLVYGINIAYKYDKKVAVLCEAEIDAMSVMEIGYCGLAVGGSSFNKVKRDIIAKSPIETVVIATDNDGPGEKLKRKIVDMLSGYCELKTVRWSEIGAEIKDINDLLLRNKEDLRGFVENCDNVESLQLLRLT